MLKIVILEDDDDLRDSMVDFFRDKDCHVTEFASVDEWLERPSKFGVDVFFIDINMPGLSGIDFMRINRTVYPGSLFYVITGNDVAEVLSEVYKSGADAYFQKPIDPEVLLSVVQRTAKVKDSVAHAGIELVLNTYQKKLTTKAGTNFIEMTMKKFIVLVGFAKAPDQFLETWEVMTLLEEAGWEFSLPVVRMLMMEIRKDLEELGCRRSDLKTHSKRGYQLLPKLSII